MSATESTDVLQQVRADVNSAMKAGERERAAALRLIADAVNQDARFGKDDAVATLQRERKKRLEAAEAFEKGGRDESAESERSEAALMEEYLPAQLSDEELSRMVDEAIAETGAGDPSQMGPVVGKVMGRAAGRTDGKRVSQAVKERLGA